MLAGSTLSETSPRIAGMTVPARPNPAAEQPKRSPISSASSAGDTEEVPGARAVIVLPDQGLEVETRRRHTGRRPGATLQHGGLSAVGRDVEPVARPGHEIVRDTALASPGRQHRTTPAGTRQTAQGSWFVERAGARSWAAQARPTRTARRLRPPDTAGAAVTVIVVGPTTRSVRLGDLGCRRSRRRGWCRHQRCTGQLSGFATRQAPWSGGTARADRG